MMDNKFDGTKINRFVVDEMYTNLFPTEDEKKRLLKAYTATQPQLSSHGISPGKLIVFGRRHK